YLVAQLAARPLPQVRVLTAHQLTPEMAEDVAAADAVIFVDAAIASAGNEVDITPLAPQGAWSMTHVFEPGIILGLAGTLYGRSPPAWLVRIQGDCFEPGEGLSLAAQRRAEIALEQIQALLPRYRLAKETA